MVELDQRLRPHSALIRQSSWSGLSESSSHESLTIPLVKSSSLSSMKAPTHSKTSFLFSTSNPSCTESAPSRVPVAKVAKTTTLGDAKPPLGRRDAPGGGGLVRRSQVCLSTFYADCAEPGPELDCRCQSAQRDSRSVCVHLGKWRPSVHHVGPLASDLQELEEPATHRAKV